MTLNTLALIVIGAAAISVLPFHGSSASEGCKLDHAVYMDRKGVATLSFKPRDADDVTNAFRLSIGKTEFSGDVFWSDDVRRPNGNVYFGCPAGELTQDQLDACGIWQDVIYTVGKDGKVGLLPAEKADPPPTLILSDLGYSLHDSKAFTDGVLKTFPDDVFALSGCTK